MLSSRLRFIYIPLCAMPRERSSDDPALANLLAPYFIVTSSTLKAIMKVNQIGTKGLNWLINFYRATALVQLWYAFEQSIIEEVSAGHKFCTL